MARLGVTEIAEIEAKVDMMAANLGEGRSALSYRLADRQLLGARLFTDPSGLTDGDIDVRAIRACYHPGSGGITLKGKTWHTTSLPDAGTLAAFRKWVVAALAHEACHLLQHRQSPARFEPDSEADAASALSAKADLSGRPEDYVAYVECDLEAEAHATQLAAELRSLDDLDRDAFEVAARGSDLMAHVRCRSTSASGDEWPEWDSLQARLIAMAWPAWERMRGR